MIVIKPFRSGATPLYLALSPSLCCVFLQRVCGFPAHSTFYVFVCLPLSQGEDWAVHPVFPALRTAPGTPGSSVDIRCVTQTCPPSTGSLGERRVCFLSYPPPFLTPPAGQPLQAQPASGWAATVAKMSLTFYHSLCGASRLKGWECSGARQRGSLALSFCHPLPPSFSLSFFPFFF